MAVYVSFFTPKGLASIHNAVFGPVRARESVAAGATSTGAAADGEYLWVMNNESATVWVATGSTPNASATAATTATTAGVAIPSGSALPFAVNTGDKIAVATAS